MGTWERIDTIRRTWTRGTNGALSKAGPAIFITGDELRALSMDADYRAHIAGMDAVDSEDVDLVSRFLGIHLKVGTAEQVREQLEAIP
jgi:hypothetical protein